MKRRNTFFLFIAGLAVILFFFAIRKYITTRNCQPWIKAEGNILTKGGRPFRFIGANAVYLVFYDDWDLDIEKAIRTAKDNNVSVLRLYVDLGWGKDSDFDRIFDIASRYGIYIILTFTDCCCISDYSNLEKYYQVHAPFCNITNNGSIRAFKKLIKEIIERRNSINGRIYRDDPTIMAWEIANELEYRNFDKSDVYDWIDEIATYIKSLDNNHLITIGIDANGSGFANDNLHDIFNVPALDFLSFHSYPATETMDLKNLVSMKENIDKVAFTTKKFLSLGRPVVMGEFGFSNSTEINNKIKSGEPEYYNLIFKEFMDTAFVAGVSGVMFWGWGVPEEKTVPMWWSKESHSIENEGFCHFLIKYKIPN